ncbi:hypothetical protein K501DRAFT_326848 [Backusella circina FSU 941]|nr:hypothetical protein K501DRAFT_326848 [Backusella circina FSU 941]
MFDQNSSKNLVPATKRPLHSQKRKQLEQLYLQDTSGQKQTTQKKDASLLQEVLDLAKQHGISTTFTDKGYLNNLTDNKPHQGVVLKATLKDTIELNHLSAIHSDHYEAIPKLNKRGSEKDRQLNASQPPLPLSLQKPLQRMPFWLALDEVQDPQNLGSIMRTAHFFGVDGVVLCSKNSAPLSPAVSKVSSGAIEVMDIYSTTNLVKFLKESNQNGWQVVGAVGDANASIQLTEFQSSCEKPTILVLGNEGSGLRTNVKTACDQFVSITNKTPTNDRFNGSVDSLNVGVAAGILIATALS